MRNDLQRKRTLLRADRDLFTGSFLDMQQLASTISQISVTLSLPLGSYTSTHIKVPRQIESS